MSLEPLDQARPETNPSFQLGAPQYLFSLKLVWWWFALIAHNTKDPDKHKWPAAPHALTLALLTPSLWADHAPSPLGAQATLKDLKEAQYRDPDGLAQILVLPLVSCVTLGKLLIHMCFNILIQSTGILMVLCSVRCLYA